MSTSCWTSSSLKKRLKFEWSKTTVLPVRKVIRDPPLQNSMFARFYLSVKMEFGKGCSATVQWFWCMLAMNSRPSEVALKITSVTGFLTLMVWRLWYGVSAAKLFSFSVLLLNNGCYVLRVCLFVRYCVAYLRCIILFPPDNPVKWYYCCCWSTCEETKAAGGYCSD